MTAKTYNRTNFHQHTFCVFQEVSFDVIQNLNPNYKSKSGSSYYFSEMGVYRLSNHWGRAANCKWRLESNLAHSTNRTRLGYANWTSFHNDNDIEKLYFIEIDFEAKTVHYFHKNSNIAPEKAMLRTASETMKTIKTIRNLFENEAWAKYFENNNIEILRKQIISQLVETNLSVLEIKRTL